MRHATTAARHLPRCATRPAARPLAALAAALLLGGCGLLYAELEVPTVSVTLLNQPFEGVPAGTPLNKTIEFDFAANGIDLFSDPSVHKELRLTEVTLELTSASGLTDLGGIQQVDISVLPPPGSPLPPIEVVSYRRSAADPNPTRVLATARSNVELSPYFTAETLRLQATANGTLPTSAWNASITGTFYMKVKLDYGDVMGR